MRSFFGNHLGISRRFPCGRVGKNDSCRNVAIGPSEGGPAGPQRRAGGDDVVDEDHRRARRRQGPGVHPEAPRQVRRPLPRRPARPSRAPACPAGARARRTAGDRRAPGAGTAAARGRRRGPAPPTAATEPGPATTSAAPAIWPSGADEQRGQRAGEVAPPALLVLENGAAQRPAVPARRRRPAARRAAPATAAGRAAPRSRRTSPAPARRSRRRSPAGAGRAARRAGSPGTAREPDGTEPGEEVVMRPPCRTGPTAPARRARRGGRVVHRRHAATSRARLVSRDRAAPRPGRRPPPGARSPDRRRRSSTPRTGRSPARGGSARRRPRAAAG